MSRFLSLIFNFTLFIALGLTVPALLTLDPVPAVSDGVRLSPPDQERARIWLKANDTTQQRTGGTRAEFTAADLRLAANYLVQRRWDGVAEVQLSPERLDLQLSLKLPDSPLAPHANLGLQLREDQGLPRLAGLRLGHTELPLDLEPRHLRRLLNLLFGLDQLPWPRGGYQTIELEQDRLVLHFQPIPGEAPARRPAAANLDAEVLAVYGAELSRGLQARPRDLAGLLPGLFRLARTRTGANGDPVAENRYVLTVLGLYAMGPEAKALFPAASALPRWTGPWVRLQGREDLSRHYLVSAALAALTDGALADMAGVYKEWRDTQGGSGFSFIDLAADRAGTRLGELATGSPGLARQVQEQIRPGLTDADLLPPIKDLPEGLSEQRFERRFGDLGSERFRRIAALIDERLETLPLYRLR